MSAWNFDDIGDLPGVNDYTYDPIATGRSEWNFGGIGNEELDDSEHAAQSRRASHRAPSPTLFEDNSQSHQQPRTQHQPAARARNAAFPHDFLHPVAQLTTHRASVAAPPPRRTESDRPANRETEYNPGHRATFGYSISSLLGSEDGPTPQSNLSDGEFVTLEDPSGDSTDSDMPTATRARNNGSRNRRGSAVVDLTATTQATSTQQSRRRKRSADEIAGEAGRAPRRRRISTERIEEIDLANDEAPSAEEELLQQQQQDAIKLQQSRQDDEGPQKIGKRQCIICMENFTNCTATSCGHFYCHECLTQALMTGEKSSDRGIGTCPVCRKPLSRTNKKTDVIPIQFMKRSQFFENQAKRGLTA
ncbi:hypothetical protein DOTSEDRAFT_69481 [Dothistroma septosporum NZE10]|uniref:RING-type domain-containing protein n=1 Tax=Dothistroma septosporum (strain NZE10 / CBS 128990) TaxID=675120 RepID=N1PX40_DOTSN|nr:hypothetical protein DOTSEDRAFT_69481 [Dothistroma septosporum NZE10]